jgi:two-component system, cell cycle sensor histidine kinase DivJ
VSRFKPVREHIETLVNAFSTRRGAPARSPAPGCGDGRWLADMSHELRTPLNIVIGLSDMLVNEGALKLDAARRSDYAQLIHASGQHLLSLIDGIMEMAKVDSGVFALRCQQVAPARVITQCVEMLAVSATHANLELRVELPPNLPDIVADERALKQILINLLSNAIKFTERGQVTVSASVEQLDLTICVEDSGVGIAADDLPHIGSPFFRARPTTAHHCDGHGLGLSIVKSLVKRLGGQLEMRSRVGEGTCVMVKLPIDGATENAPRPVPMRECSQHGVSPLTVHCASGG